jgi:hypothetical protein
MKVELHFRNLPADGRPLKGCHYEGFVMSAGAAIGRCIFHDSLIVAYVGPWHQIVGDDPAKVEASIEEYFEMATVGRERNQKVIDLLQRRWEKLARSFGES